LPAKLANIVFKKVNFNGMKKSNECEMERSERVLVGNG
jgi:hypothetical protein